MEQDYFGDLARSKISAGQPVQKFRAAAAPGAGPSTRKSARSKAEAVDNHHGTELKVVELLLGALALSDAAPPKQSEVYQMGAMTLMLKSVPFIVAGLAVVFTISFPTPRDVLDIGRLIPREAIVTFDEVDHGPTVVSLAQDTPVEPYVAKIESSGCLDQLADLPTHMIEQCSQLVAEAVIQIASFEGAKATDLNSDSAMLVERLRLAAARVCRARWAVDPGMALDTDDPVCAVSTIDLASAS
jgi:hypothetical protein